MAIDPDLDQRVARRAAAHARHALPLQAERLAIRRAGRDRHVERFAVIKLDPAARALRRVEEGNADGVGHVLAPHPDAAAPPAEQIGADILERSEEHTSELQSLMRISYAVFCLQKKTPHT